MNAPAAWGGRPPATTDEIVADAIAYTLRRVCTEADFRWHMLDTETLVKLCDAHAAITGQNPLHVMEQIERDGPTGSSAVSRCAELRDREVG